MTEYENNVIFLGTFVPEQISHQVTNLSLASNRFQHAFIRALKPKLIISLPVPNNFMHRYQKDENGVHYLCVRERKMTKLNFLFRSLVDTWAVCKKITPCEKGVIITYNFEFYNFLPILVLRYIYRYPVYIIIADYFQFQKSLINSVFNFFLKRFEGAIILNENVSINSNSVLVNGIIEDGSIKIYKENKLRKSIILSGSLGETTGLRLALDFAKQNKDFILHLTGRPFRLSMEEFLQIINEANNITGNIIYHGVLEYHQYIAVMDQCDIAFSLRNPEDVEHEYNFPSKILEYLAASKIVVSTKIYKGIPNNILVFTDFEVSSLSKEVRNLVSLESSSISAMRNTIAEFLEMNFSEETLRMKIYKLIDTTNK